MDQDVLLKSLHNDCALAIHARLQEWYPGGDVRMIVDSIAIDGPPVGVSVWHEDGRVTAVYLHVQEH